MKRSTAVALTKKALRVIAAPMHKPEDDPKKWPDKIVISENAAGRFAVQRYSSLTKKYRGTVFMRYKYARDAAERNAKELGEEIVDRTRGEG